MSICLPPPDDLERVYKEWPNTRTPEQAYLEGYGCGLSWKFSFKPRGPLVFHVINYHIYDSVDIQLWTAYCNLTQALYDIWMRGWEDGMKNRNRTLMDSECLQQLNTQTFSPSAAS